MWIYNTLTREREPFHPLEPGLVRMYFCGPTVYNRTHLGHLRPALTGDVLARALKDRGFRVRYLSNFTDIDDKIIQRSREEGVEAGAIAERYIADYLQVMRRMGCDQVEAYLRVSEHIDGVVRMIERLVESGYAYAVDGDVFFAVERWPDYGKLSRRHLDDMLAGARVQVDERKRNPVDFALWKAGKPGEPTWESPWGPGRPGWHIECSAMSTAHLGESFDIHGGGDDLVFPHHENEIAQSESATGKPFARYWIHNGMVLVNDEKMSKSLGNTIWVDDLLERVSPDALRYFLLSTHYRKPLNYRPDALEQAARGWERLEELCRGLAAAVGDGARPALEPVRDAGDGSPGRPAEWPGIEDPEALRLLREVGEHRARFDQAIDDDLNTALALGSLFQMGSAVRARLAAWTEGGPPVGDRRFALGQALAILEGRARTLGLMRRGEETPEGNAPARGATGERGPGLEPLIELLLAVRQELRAQRNWPLADRIRDQLQQLGIAVEDHPGGSRWHLD